MLAQWNRVANRKLTQDSYGGFYLETCITSLPIKNIKILPFSRVAAFEKNSTVVVN